MRFAELDAVTIDAYGTLVELADPVPALQRGLSELGVERGADAVARAFARESAYYREHSFAGRDHESLVQLRRECASIILRELDSDVEADAFMGAFIGALRFELLPGAEAAVRSLRSRGLALAVVSNWDFALGEHLRGLSVGDLPVVTSAEVGEPKPSPAVFLRALEVLGVRPERALHIGDDANDEGGARAAGMHFAPAPLASAVEAIA